LLGFKFRRPTRSGGVHASSVYVPPLHHAFFTIDVADWPLSLNNGLR
jgi:hypothetical protein